MGLYCGFIEYDIFSQLWTFNSGGGNTQRVETGLYSHKRCWIFKVWFWRKFSIVWVLYFAGGNTRKVGTGLWSYELKSRPSCGWLTHWRKSAKRQVFHQWGWLTMIYIDEDEEIFEICQHADSLIFKSQQNKCQSNLQPNPWLIT